MKFYEQKFEHDCDRCQWIGHRNEQDWWFCPSCDGGTMLKRYGDDGPDYGSMPVDAYVSFIARGDKLPSKWDTHFQEVCERFLGIEYAEKIFEQRYETKWAILEGNKCLVDKGTHFINCLKHSYNDSPRHCKAYYLDREKDWVISIAVGGSNDATSKFTWFQSSKYPLSSYEEFDISIRINDEHVAPEDYPEGLSQKLFKITPLLGFGGYGGDIPWEPVRETILMFGDFVNEPANTRY